MNPPWDEKGDDAGSLRAPPPSSRRPRGSRAQRNLELIQRLTIARAARECASLEIRVNFSEPHHRAAEGDRMIGRYDDRCRRGFLDMLGVVAEFETNLRKKRQAEGNRKSEGRGVHKGRKAQIDVHAVREMIGQGKGPSTIARELGIGRATVYRLTNGAGGRALGVSR